MPSATNIAEVRSISMPPYFSGRCTEVRPSSPALRSTDTATPGSWCWMASTLGAISLVQNSSVVRAMARCSSVKSSGEKIRSGDVGSMRNEPPLGLVGEIVEDAIGIIPYQVFENACGALTSADTHGDHAIARVFAMHFAQDGGGELRTGAAEGMAERDGATVGVHAIEIQASFANHSQRLDREGFIQFDDVDIFLLQAGERESFRNRYHRPDPHDL